MNNENKKSHDLSHIKGGRYLKDMIYGANDGIITTFAVVAGVVGASLSPTIIILIGLANLLADGFSMASSNYLGTKSQISLFKREREVERAEIRFHPEKEREEIRAILVEKGYVREDVEKMVELISKNERFWIDFMMQEELLFAPLKSYHPKKAALATFLSFVTSGSLPILPYIVLGSGFESIFIYAIVVTAATLFIVGALRALFTGHKWYLAGGEMLFVGGVAATISYGVGFLLKGVVG